MRWLLWIVILIGAPIYVADMFIHGTVDWTQVGISALFFVGAIVGAYFWWQREQVKDAQKQYWLNQRKR